MNYRHVYHAGNFADVIKHATVALILDYLQKKDAGLMVLDAHAGVGLYDLSGVEAQKTGEWQGGVGKIWGQDAVPDPLLPWLQAVRYFNSDGGLLAYPGSPMLARHLMRPQDRLVLVEKHPQDYLALSSLFHYDRQVQVHEADAYAQIKAALPPPERRGLVLIDPPFEEKDEHQRVLRGLGHALKRWPTGCYVIWYPIKAYQPIEAFLDGLRALAPPPGLVVELMLRPGDDPYRLNGSGLVVLNPPWVLQAQLAEILPFLVQNVAPEQGFYNLRALTD